MPKVLNIQDWLLSYKDIPLIDVRTPAEYEKGHVPGSVNLPLFTNEERAVVGTLYKKEGKQAALDKGLDLVAPKLSEMAQQALLLAKNGKLVVHCWRGGMRSSSVAWMLEKFGLSTYTLKGGYKFFRRKVLQTFDQSFDFLVLGGRTGSSKSKVLYALARKGEQIIDLEKLAHHKGSSYGHLGELKQPTQEMFENKLAMALLYCDDSKPIWLEDESRLIGNKVMPAAIFNQMRSCRVYYLDVPFEERVKYLAAEYGLYSKENLIEATRRIEKRLGPQQTKQAVQFIEENELEEACAIILRYYDKAYDYGLAKRDQALIIRISSTSGNVSAVLEKLSLG